MTISAVFGALCFVLTAFLPIPYPNQMGYFNFGDALTIFIAIYVGPIEGAFVGLIGGVFGDLYANAANFVPFTIVAKLLMALVSGCFFRLFKHSWPKYIFPFIGGLLMAATYFVAYWLFFGFNMTYLAIFDVIQGLGCAAIAIVFYFVLRKFNIFATNESDY